MELYLIINLSIITAVVFFIAYKETPDQVDKLALIISFLLIPVTTALFFWAINFWYFFTAINPHTNYESVMGLFVLVISFSASCFFVYFTAYRKNGMNKLKKISDGGIYFWAILATGSSIPFGLSIGGESYWPTAISAVVAWAILIIVGLFCEFRVPRDEEHINNHSSK